MSWTTQTKEHAPIAASPPQVQFRPGDLVMVLRDLEHPAWTGAEAELIGHARVVELVPASGNSRNGRDGATELLVRVSNGSLYEMSTGRQQFGGRTLIRRHPIQHGDV